MQYKNNTLPDEQNRRSQGIHNRVNRSLRAYLHTDIREYLKTGKPRGIPKPSFYYKTHKRLS
jgi:hypothetical protein